MSKENVSVSNMALLSPFVVMIIGLEISNLGHPIRIFRFIVLIFILHHPSSKPSNMSMKTSHTVHSFQINKIHASQP